ATEDVDQDRDEDPEPDQPGEEDDHRPEDVEERVISCDHRSLPLGLCRGSTSNSRDQDPPSRQVRASPVEDERLDIFLYRYMIAPWHGQRRRPTRSTRSRNRGGGGSATAPPAGTARATSSARCSASPSRRSRSTCACCAKSEPSGCGTSDASGSIASTAGR